MNEIKLRLDILEKTLSSEKHEFIFVDIEYAALQIRMILELIGISAIAANKSLFEQFQRKVLKEYSFSIIASAAKDLNSNYYPMPAMHLGAANRDDGTKHHKYEYLKEGFPTEEELKDLYNDCGNLLHIRNPYRKALNIEGKIDFYRDWIKKIRMLLELHFVWLDSEHLYLVQMNDDQRKVHMVLAQGAL